MTGQRTELMDLWHHLTHAIHDRFRPIFREFNLPPMTLILLKQVNHHPGITLSELARRAESAKSYVSRMVDSLVAEGYLERRPDPADQRLIRLFPTDLARSRLDALESRIREEWAQVTAELSQADTEAVVRSFRVLLEALRRTRNRAESGDHRDA
ncbi:MAG TPA: MarR family transcriptional regulator [Symbiobacteriaceae bacterium]